MASFKGGMAGPRADGGSTCLLETERAEEEVESVDGRGACCEVGLGIEKAGELGLMEGDEGGWGAEGVLEEGVDAEGGGESFLAGVGAACRGGGGGGGDALGRETREKGAGFEVGGCLDVHLVAPLMRGARGGGD